MALTFVPGYSCADLMKTQSDSAAFDTLLQALEPEASSPHESFRRFRARLVRLFAWKHCEDPEDLADETISRLVKNIQSGQEISQDRPYRYVRAIARNVFREYLRAKEKSGIETDVDELPDLPAPEETEDCWTLCLAQLSPDKREFLEKYFLDSIDREQFAREKGLTINALRLTVFRYKAALRLCIENCIMRLSKVRN
jgi:DNA-directed RNA polymerase specialized sigma24 family protein